MTLPALKKEKVQSKLDRFLGRPDLDLLVLILQIPYHQSQLRTLQS